MDTGFKEVVTLNFSIFGFFFALFATRKVPGLCSCGFRKQLARVRWGLGVRSTP